MRDLEEIFPLPPANGAYSVSRPFSLACTTKASSRSHSRRTPLVHYPSFLFFWFIVNYSPLRVSFSFWRRTSFLPPRFFFFHRALSSHSFSLQSI